MAQLVETGQLTLQDIRELENTLETLASEKHKAARSSTRKTIRQSKR